MNIFSKIINVTKIKKLFFQYDWEIVEIQGATFKIVWGIWLMLPFSTFKDLAVYDALAKVAPESAWGFIVMTLGILHLMAISSGSIFWRRALILIACMFWIFIAMAFSISRIGSALIPLTIVIAFFMAVNYLRLGVPTIITKYKDRIFKI